MHPYLHRLFPAHSLALGNLIFMMGKPQIDAAGMDVELLTQVFG